MSSYTIAESAEADLDEIWEYIARDSEKAADRLLATFKQEFASLSVLPG